jgi:hypothetical protein
MNEHIFHRCCTPPVNTPKEYFTVNRPWLTNLQTRSVSLQLQRSFFALPIATVADIILPILSHYIRIAPPFLLVKFPIFVGELP